MPRPVRDAQLKRGKALIVSQRRVPSLQGMHAIGRFVMNAVLRQTSSFIAKPFIFQNRSRSNIGFIAPYKAEITLLTRYFNIFPRFIEAPLNLTRRFVNDPQAASAGSLGVLPIRAFSNVPYRKPPGGGALRSFECRG
ncbi:MAG: hypothetical protein KGJ16_13295 [Betaproteobacteria bacterium]|nr:hypothetical protein [Betaproteobacteria bacterium]